ncbi:MAG: RNA 2',3'-cyclic phosphodiesterase [Beijerinckiaceae bacterium]
MPRLFTGLEIPPDIAFELSLLRGGLYGARWIDPENYHVTLRFVGDIDNRTARDFAHALDDISAPEIAVTLDVLDTFGGDRPRAVLARARADKTLTHLQADHERAARMVGCAPETRKFVPHVTLARLRSSSPLAVADWLSSRAIIRSLTFTASRFVLFSARDSVGGGPYIVEADYPLSQYA